MALAKLNHTEEAAACFEGLIAFGIRQLKEPFKMDYFAVSLPDLQIWEDDLNEKYRRCYEHLIALGCKGMDRLKQNTHTK